MRTLGLSFLLALSLASGSSASAQDAPAAQSVAEPPAAAPPDAAPAPAEPAPAPAAKPEELAAPPSAAIACVLGDHSGIREADARTSAALVCEALREEGVDVEPEPVPAAPARKAYRTSLRSLGKLVLLQVSALHADGRVERSESLRLAKIEEVPVAALRMAEAFAKGKPVEDNAKVDNLVGQETRVYDKRHGETLVGVGVFGYGITGTEAIGGYGAFARVMYETSRYAVGGELRLGGSGSDSGDSTLFGLSVGGRYFLSEADFAPFIGAGLGALWLNATDDEITVRDGFGEYTYQPHRSGAGVAPYAEIGLEVLRTYDARLDLLLRADVPLYDLQASDDDSSQYSVPISIMASVAFD